MDSARAVGKKRPHSSCDAAVKQKRDWQSEREAQEDAAAAFIATLEPSARSALGLNPAPNLIAAVASLAGVKPRHVMRAAKAVLRSPRGAHVHFILYKPRGVLCQPNQRGREARHAWVMDAIPTGFPRVPFAGRLDEDTEGLLLFSDDSALIRGLIDPTASRGECQNQGQCRGDGDDGGEGGAHVIKVYHVEVAFAFDHCHPKDPRRIASFRGARGEALDEAARRRAAAASMRLPLEVRGVTTAPASVELLEEGEEDIVGGGDGDDHSGGGVGGAVVGGHGDHVGGRDAGLPVAVQRAGGSRGGGGLEGAGDGWLAVVQAKAQRVAAQLAAAEAEEAAAAAAAEAGSANGTPTPRQVAAAVEAAAVRARRLRNQLAALTAKAAAVAESRAGVRGFWVRVGIGEGKNRQVRRLALRAGLVVRRLVRVALGPLTLDAEDQGGRGGSLGQGLEESGSGVRSRAAAGGGGGGGTAAPPPRRRLRPGEARCLSLREIEACYAAAGLDAPSWDMALPLPLAPSGEDFVADLLAAAPTNRAE